MPTSVTSFPINTAPRDSGPGSKSVAQVMQRIEDTNPTTMTGALTLVAKDCPIQALDPGGSARTITLPAEATSQGLVFTIINTADAEEAITVNDDGGTQRAMIHRGEQATLRCDGTTWYASVASPALGNFSYAEITQSTTITLTAASPRLLSITPGAAGGAESITINLPAATAPGQRFEFYNQSPAGSVTLKVKINGGGTVQAIGGTKSGGVFSTGTTWLPLALGS